MRRGPSPRSTFDLQELLSSTAVWCDASMLSDSHLRTLAPPSRVVIRSGEGTSG
jgi:hypothetical protein